MQAKELKGHSPKMVANHPWKTCVPSANFFYTHYCSLVYREQRVKFNNLTQADSGPSTAMECTSLACELSLHTPTKQLIKDASHELCYLIKKTSTKLFKPIDLPESLQLFNSLPSKFILY